MGILQRIAKVAAWTPWESDRPMRNRRGELVRQQVDVPVRLLAGAGALVFAGLMRISTTSLYGMIPSLIPIAIGAWIALFGVKTVIIDPEPSDEFLRAADPTRPLPASPGAEETVPTAELNRPATSSRAANLRRMWHGSARLLILPS